MRKSLGILVIVFFLFWFIGVSGCQNSADGSIVGTYHNQDMPEEILELHEDSTFYLYEYTVEFTGEWQVEEDTLTLTFDDMPTTITAQGTISGKTIVDQEGKTWVKE